MINTLRRAALCVGVIMGFGLVSACGTSTATPAPNAATATGVDQSTTTTTTSPSATEGTTATTTSTAATEPVISKNGIVGVNAIADTFDTATGLQPTDYGTTASNIGGLPPESGDPNGSFRFVCFGGQLLKDDPLLLPGQVGASHLHQFWGNTGANANSTYESLRTSGQTTCQNTSAPPVNRTAYWMPAMLDGAGNAVKPDIIDSYYKALPESDPTCQLIATACVPLPNGLRYTFGYNMATGTGGPNDKNSTDYWMNTYECWSDDIGTKVIQGDFHTIDALVAAGCPSGARLVVMFVAPACWDGQNVDVADHRSHVVWSTRWVAAANRYGCPLDHPYMLPNFSGHIIYTTDANFAAGKWRLSSDDMASQMAGHTVPAGSTLHMDYWEAWSPTVKAMWQKGCIDAHKSCNRGDLGNGTMLKLWSPITYPHHQLVPLQ